MSKLRSFLQLFGKLSFYVIIMTFVNATCAAIGLKLILSPEAPTPAVSRAMGGLVLAMGVFNQVVMLTTRDKKK